MQGLLNKQPGKRLDWPELLEHPFVAETAAETTARREAVAEASRVAEERPAWNSPGALLHSAQITGFKCRNSHLQSDSD